VRSASYTEAPENTAGRLFTGPRLLIRGSRVRIPDGSPNYGPALGRTLRRGAGVLFAAGERGVRRLHGRCSCGKDRLSAVWRDTRGRGRCRGRWTIGSPMAGQHLLFVGRHILRSAFRSRRRFNRSEVDVIVTTGDAETLAIWS
jgi:hypothetical protein